MDLTTKYAGLTLRNPIIVGSSGLTENVEEIKKCEAAGAGAVVMKSLFEEQIQQADSGLEDSAMMHAEAMAYLEADLDKRYGPHEYLKTIADAKKAVSIPVIASINCFSTEWWVDYAQQIEAAGADAIELNVYVPPFQSQLNSTEMEKIYLDILNAVKSQTKIPVMVKIPATFTAFSTVARQMAENGADALVLFNRFVHLEFDIDKIELKMAGSFSDPVGFYNTLRWIAILSGKSPASLAASGGISSYEHIVKQILAGASAVQVTSAIYKDGLGVINKILAGVTQWAERHNFDSLDAFQGLLNHKQNMDTENYFRAQYIKGITS